MSNDDFQYDDFQNLVESVVNSNTFNRFFNQFESPLMFTYSDDIYFISYYDSQWHSTHSVSHESKVGDTIYSVL